MEASAPASASRSAYRIAVYWLPASLWWTTPVTSWQARSRTHRVGLLDPATQRVGVHPDLAADPGDRRGDRQLRILLTGLLNQTDRPVPQLLGVLPRCWHGLTLHPSVESDPPRHPGQFMLTTRSLADVAQALGASKQPCPRPPTAPPGPTPVGDVASQYEASNRGRRPPGVG